MICPLNEALNEALGDKQLDEYSVSELASFGITIQGPFMDEKEKFMSEIITVVEADDLLNIIPWLQEIKCDMVYFSGSSVVSNLKGKFISLLSESKIPFVDTTAYAPVKPAIEFNVPVLIRFKKSPDVMFDPYKVSKIIQIVNSNSINIK
jgi:hypothetical protein